MNELLISIVTALGPLGIAGLMLVSMIVPIIPAEFTIGYAGVAAAESEISITPTILLSIAGVTIGNMALYAIGHHFTRSKIEKKLDRVSAFLGYDSDDLQKAEKYFKRHGILTIGLGELLPGVRFAVCLLAGIIEVDFWKYAAIVLISSAIWVGIFCTLGYVFSDSFVSFFEYYEGVGYTLLAGIAGFIVYRLFKMRRDSQ